MVPGLRGVADDGDGAQEPGVGSMVAKRLQAQQGQMEQTRKERDMSAIKTGELWNVLQNRTDLADHQKENLVEAFKVVASMDYNDALVFVREALGATGNENEGFTQVETQVEALSKNFDTLLAAMVNLDKRLKALELDKLERLKPAQPVAQGAGAPAAIWPLTTTMPMQIASATLG